MARRVLTSVLLLFVAFSVVWAYARPAAAPARDPASTEAHGAASVVVYYLHGDRRCATCESIERGARRAVEAEFARRLADGELELRTRNTDRPEHAHLVDDFGLVASSLVVTTGDGTDYAVLDRVWQLVGDDAAFDAYVAAEIRRIAGGDW